MVEEGEFEHEEENAVADHDEGHEGGGLASPDLAGEDGGGEVPEDEQARRHRRRQEEQPLQGVHWDEAEEEGGGIEHEGVAVDAHDLHEGEGDGDAPEQEPDGQGEEEGVAIEDRHGVDQVGDVGLELLKVVPVEVAVHVRGNLEGGEREIKGGGGGGMSHGTGKGGRVRVRQAYHRRNNARVTVSDAEAKRAQPTPSHPIPSRTRHRQTPNPDQTARTPGARKALTARKKTMVEVIQNGPYRSGPLPRGLLGPMRSFLKPSGRLHSLTLPTTRSATSAVSTSK